MARWDAHGPCNSLLLGCWSALAAVAIAGCGGGDETAPPPPLPAPTFDRDGSVAIDTFNAYLEAVDEPWESSPAEIATRLAHPEVGEGEELSAVTADANGDDTTVDVNVRGLADDSVRDLRVSVALRRQDGRWKITEARWTQRCRPGRGHQNMSTQPCI